MSSVGRLMPPPQGGLDALRMLHGRGAALRSWFAASVVAKGLLHAD